MLSVAIQISKIVIYITYNVIHTNYDVKKIYTTGEKKYCALGGINLSINKGELVCILGPSGAGKSTLLNLLGGMDTVTSGTIKVGNEIISKLKDKALTTYRAKQVGFIFQFYNILPTLTVLENVELVNDIVDNPKDAKTILKEVGLEKQLNKFPSELSGGEQQRVSIARAIAKDPQILLCDEPTGALDSKTGTEVLRLLKDCTKKGTTVIIVTHNSLISEIANHTIKLKNGKVIEDIVRKKPKKIDEVVW